VLLEGSRQLLLSDQPALEQDVTELLHRVSLLAGSGPSGVWA
jgi:hypothetical protein